MWSLAAAGTAGEPITAGSGHHTFSFSGFHDPERMGVGPLRVINEDTIAPNRGFETHAHRDMEIISYVLEGRLSHKDSLGRKTTIGPGTIQRISAGSGIEHSEVNPSHSELLHFLQIWIVPDRKGLQPRYDEVTFDLCPTESLVRELVTPTGEGGTIPIYQDVRMSAAILPCGSDAVRHSLKAGCMAYLHVAKGSAVVAGQLLAAGDSAKVTGQQAVELSDGENAQVLIFEMLASAAEGGSRA